MATTGRPRHWFSDRDRAVAEELAAAGVPRRTIALSLGVGERCLRDRLKPELERGDTRAHAAVAASLFRAVCAAATEEAGAGAGGRRVAVHRAGVLAAIWWTKARAGWRATLAPEGGDEAPPVRLDPEELHRRLARLSPRRRWELARLLDAGQGPDAG